MLCHDVASHQRKHADVIALPGNTQDYCSLT